jgi:hypothetical protein
MAAGPCGCSCCLVVCGRTSRPLVQVVWATAAGVCTALLVHPSSARLYFTMHHGPSLGCSEATDCPARLQPSTAVVCCWLGAAASLELHAWPPSPPSNAACSFCQGRVSIVVSQCPYGSFAIDGCKCPCASLRRGRGCACVCALSWLKEGAEARFAFASQSAIFVRWFGTMWSCFSGRA